MEQQELLEEKRDERAEAGKRTKTELEEREILSGTGEGVWDEAGEENLLQGTKSAGCLDNAGVGVIEIILILVVLVALILIFKEQLTSMVQRAMDALEQSMEKVLS